jgi:1-aminocyclopropane-1-carboxylate deaminase/D-cysteine desulfhydrase-like pyridoxal-dependent ACC family enzyme
VRVAKAHDLLPDVLAYANCFCEITEQFESLDIQPSHHCSSYDSTQAGLELGKAALGNPIRIMGIAPADWSYNVAYLVARYANQAAGRIGLSCSVNEDDVFNKEGYVGDGYGIMTPEGIEIIKLLARTEGGFLTLCTRAKRWRG